MRIRAWCLLIAILACAVPAAAQVTGSVAGTVHDASGAVLPGVTVTIRGAALQRKSATTVSATDGSYRIPLVPPGQYDVTVELQGFTTQTRHVEVAINQQTTVDFALAIAGMAESVVVSAEAPVIQVTRSDIENTVQQRTIDALPLNGRNFTDLIALVPGAKPDPNLSSGGNMEIFGERAGAVSYLVDGAENNDPVNGGNALRYTQDSIKEFQVITTGYEAEFGRAQGGVANIVTRSGTDALDGRAFWFGRNDRFDSNNIPEPSPAPANYVAPKPPKLVRNQWGGTLGGPIAKDRAFFFGSFEKMNETRGVNIDQSKIPAFVLSGIATPSHSENFGLAPTTDQFTGLGKVDVNLTMNNRLTASINRSTQDQGGLISSPVAGTVALPSAAATVTQPGTSGILRHTSVLRQSMFLESTAEYMHIETGNNLDQTQRSEPILLLLRSGFLQTGAPFGGQVDRQSGQFQFRQALSWYKPGAAGDHQFKVGWDIDHVAFTGFNQVTNDVEYSPGFLAADPAAPFATNFGLYGFQQSAARFFTLSSSPDGNLNVNVRTTDVSGFAQDTWQVHPDVTLDLGVRYDYSSLFGDYKKALAPRLGVAWDVGGRHRTVVKANYGLFFDRNLLAAAANVPAKGGFFTKNVFDVALPRLGADYSNSLIDYVITSGFPNGKGGFGPAENPLYKQFATDLRNDPLTLYKLLGIPVADAAHAPVITSANIQQLSGLTPDQALALIKGEYPGTDFRFFQVPGGSIVGNGVLDFFPRGPLEVTRTVSQYSTDLIPYTNAISAGVDQQIGENFSVSAMFVHRRSRDLLTQRIINLYDAHPGDPNFGKTIDGGPQIQAVTYDGLVDYDGLILSLQKRFSRRYQYGISYTASRARDNLLTGQVGSTFANNNHPEYDYGPSNQSAPNIFVANGLVVVPFDINLSAIAFWRSGTAFNPRGIIDSDGDGLVDQRDLTQPRNAFRIKPYGDVDLRAEKKVPFGRHTASVLVEAFNVFNRDNVLNVNAVAGPTFGTPLAYLPGREIQFGLRYFFGE